MVKFYLQDENWLKEKIAKLKNLEKRARACDKKMINDRINTFEQFLNDLKIKIEA